MKATLWLSLAALAVACTAALAADWDWSADTALQRAIFMSSKDPNVAEAVFLHGFWDNLWGPSDPNGLEAYHNARLQHLDALDSRGFNFIRTFFRYDTTNFDGHHFLCDGDFVDAAVAAGVSVMGGHSFNLKVCDPNDWSTRNIAYFSDAPVLAWYIWDDVDNCVNTDTGCDPNTLGSPPANCYTSNWQCWSDRRAAVDCRAESVEDLDPDAYTVVAGGVRPLVTELLSDPDMSFDVYLPELYPPSCYGTGYWNTPSLLVCDVAAYQPVVACCQYARNWPQAGPKNAAYQALANGAVGITHWTLSCYDPNDPDVMLYDLTDPNDANSVAALDALTAFRDLTQEFEDALLYGTPQRVSGFDDPESDPVLATYWMHEQSGTDELWLIVVNISSSTPSITVPVPLAYNMQLDEKDSDSGSSLDWAYQSSPSYNYVLTGTLAPSGFYVAKFTANWCLGDMNCDGTVGLADINAFSTALSYPPSYVTAYPGCPMVYNGDANGDRKLTTADINPFVAWVAQNPAPTCPQ